MLAGARVLAYAVVDEAVSFTGKLRLHSGDERVGPVPRLAICQSLEDDQLMLFHCDGDWNVVGIQAWDGPGAKPTASVEEVKERAERYYDGISTKWIAHPASLAEAKAYHGRLLEEARCSFCGELSARMIFTSPSGARICSACVRQFHAGL